MAWNPSWNPLVQLSRRMGTPKTLELEQIKSVYLYARNAETNEQPSTNYVLYADGSNGTFWASDGIQSTIAGLGNLGYLSTIPLTLYLSTLSSATLQVSSITSRNLYIQNPGTSVFSDGYISAHTVVVYGSNTAYVDGTLQLTDIFTNLLTPIYFKDGAFWSGSSTYMLISTFLISSVKGLASAEYVSSLTLQSTTFGIRDLINSDKLESTVKGLTSAGYPSTLSMQSTVGFFNDYFAILEPSTLNSTVQGLGNTDYISSFSLQSTNAYFESTLGVVSPEMLQSTIDKLAEIKYVSTSQLASTSFEFLSKTIYVKPLALASTVRGLGTANFISTRTLQSTVRSLYFQRITDSNLASTVYGLSWTDYVSTPDLESTTDFFLSTYPSYLDITSSVIGLGSAEYVSTLSLFSTVRFMSNGMFLARGLTSTIVNLGRIRFISTSGLTSTVRGVLTFPNRVDATQLASTVTGLSNDFFITTSSIASTIDSLSQNTGAVSLENFASTIEGLGSANYISSLDLVSTTNEFEGFLTLPRLRSTTANLGSQDYVSSTGLQSTVFYLSTNLLNSSALRSTIIALGSVGYVSTLSLYSTVRKLITQSDSLNLPSTINNLGTQDYVSSTGLQSTVRDIIQQFTSTLSLRSTVRGLGSVTYISTQSLYSTVASVGNGFPVLESNLVSTTVGLSRTGYVSTLSLQSTVSNLFKFSLGVPGLISTADGFGSASYISSLSFESTVRSLVISASPDSNLIRMVNTLGNRYISTSALTSTVRQFNYVDPTSVTSTVTGLGNRYFSTLSLASTVDTILSNPYAILSNLPSTIDSLGSLGYVSTPSIESTVTFLTGTTGRTQLPDLISTVTDLQLLYIARSTMNSTVATVVSQRFTPASLRSTTQGLGSVVYISSPSLVSTVSFMFATSLTTSRLTSTVTHLASYNYISTPSLISTTAFFTGSNQASNADLESSITGFGFGYASTTMLISTTSGLFGIPNTVQVVQLTSTIQGLGTANYISVLSLQSTANYMGNNPNAFFKDQLVSTVRDLTVTGYVNSSQLQSTVLFLSTNQLNVPQVESTITHLGTTRFVSTASLGSTVQAIFSNYQQLSQVGSTIEGLGTARLISTLSLASTVAFFTTPDSALSTFALQSTILGLGTATYVSSLSFQSTVGSLFSLNPNNQQVTSTTLGLGTLGFISTSGLTSSVRSWITTFVHFTSTASTVTGLGTARYISTGDLLSTYTFFTINYMTSLGNSSTINNLTSLPFQYLSTMNLQSTTANIVQNKVLQEDLQSTVTTLSVQNYASSTQLASTVFSINTTIGSLSLVATPNFTSSFTGLGTAGYISTLTLQSTTKGVTDRNATFVQPVNLASSVTGLSSAGYRSTLDRVSIISSIFLNVSSAVIGTQSEPKVYSLDLGFSNSINIQTDLRDSNLSNIITIAARLQPGGFTFPAVSWTTDLVNFSIQSNNQAYGGFHVYTGSVYYSMLNSQLLFSYTGSNWTEITTASSVFSNAFNFNIGTTAVSPDLVVATTGANALYANTDTYGWIGRYTQNVSNWSRIRSSNITFTFQNFGTSNPPHGGVAYNGIFYCLCGTGFGSSNVNCVFTSRDGISWTQLNIGFSGGTTPFTVGQYMYIVELGTTGNMRRSVDGVNWETLNSFASGLNVAFGQNGSKRGNARNRGWLVNGTTSGSNRFLLFYNTRASTPIVISNILPANIGGAQPTLSGGYFYLGPLTKSSYVNYEVIYNEDNIFNEMWITSTSMASFVYRTNGSYAGNLQPWSWTTVYDNRATSIAFSNLEILSYDSVPYLNMRTESNFIYASRYSPISSIINFNCGMYVDGSLQNTSFGGIIAYNPSCNIISTSNTPIGQSYFSNAVACDVDGRFITTDDNPQKPTTTVSGFTGYSDARIKLGISTAKLDVCYSNISSINLYHYNYISSFYDEFQLQDKSLLGFLADEVSTCFPKSVGTIRLPFMSYDTMTLNADQIKFSLYGVVQTLISTVEHNSTILSEQVQQIDTLSAHYSTLIAVSGNV